MKIVRMNFEIPNDLRKKLKEKLAKEGRSIKWFYPKCEAKETGLVYDNEVSPDIESGDFSYTLENGLSEYVIN